MATAPDSNFLDGVMCLDTDTGKTDVASMGANVQLEEHVMVPKPGSSKEGEGWLVGVGFDMQAAKLCHGVRRDEPCGWSGRHRMVAVLGAVLFSRTFSRGLNDAIWIASFRCGLNPGQAQGDRTIKRKRHKDCHEPPNPPKKILDAITFPFKAGTILLVCAAINWMTSPHHWWMQWVALGLGIALAVKAARAVKVLIIAGR